MPRMSAPAASPVAAVAAPSIRTGSQVRIQQIVARAADRYRRRCRTGRGAAPAPQLPSPRSHSSITTSLPASPNRRSSIMSRSAASAASVISSASVAVVESGFSQYTVLAAAIAACAIGACSTLGAVMATLLTRWIHAESFGESLRPLHNSLDTP